MSPIQGHATHPLKAFSTGDTLKQKALTKLVRQVYWSFSLDSMQEAIMQCVILFLERVLDILDFSLTITWCLQVVQSKS